MWVEGALVALAALVFLLLLDAYVRDSPTPRNDELIYELMAQKPFAGHTFPFANRLAVPTLVHVLPFGHTFSFSAIAWLTTAACGGVTFVLLRRFDIDRRLAAGLGIGLALSPVLFAASLHQGRSVDPESALVMLAGGLAIADRRPLALGVIVFVGVFVREAALFLVPFAYAFWAQRLWDRDAAVNVLGASAAGIAAYAGIRLAVPSLYRDQVPGYDSLLGGRTEVVRKALAKFPVTVRRVAFAFGPLWLAAPFALPRLRYARAGLALIACCLLAMTFAIDWGRVIFLAAPVIVVAAAWTVKDRPRLAALMVAALLALDLTYVVYMEDFGGAENGIVKVGHTSYPVR